MPTPNPANETIDDATATFVAAAHALGPRIAAHRDALSRGPDLPPEIADALARAGLTRLWLPRNLGGAELPPVDYFRVIEALSTHDASVGWSASIASTGCRAAGLLAPSVATDLLGAGGFVAGSLSPTGRAVREGNGWRISGRWPWASFITYSTVTVAICIEHDTNGVACTAPDGSPALRGVMLPTSQVTVRNTWDGSGLRSSGSHDFDIDDVRVDDASTFSLARFEATPHQAGALYALPFITMFALGITAVSLGIARGSIDALIDLAQHKVAAGMQAPLRERASVQASVAKAELALRSARAFLFETVDVLWTQQVSGRAADMTQRALARMASFNVVNVAKDVAQMCFSAAGGSAARNAAPFGRQLQDAQVIAQHLAFAPEHLEISGRLLLGMPAGTFRF
ncbi:acyl-CoA dehydrogenase family protein [Pandoraea anhela]|uniref:Acyl-CoA dehydrogenase n=1 Tax=Pandoraea anhela TaxID=2508295 RepID=A0A5E4UK65_9BURK|nr:acyl-CoA dehydrogenase family protein [Pandoraea anhela]VVD99932.1 acyl-CoA dehydrogenase [Pandoraea anhela]